MDKDPFSQRIQIPITVCYIKGVDYLILRHYKKVINFYKEMTTEHRLQEKRDRNIIFIISSGAFAPYAPRLDMPLYRI